MAVLARVGLLKKSELLVFKINVELKVQKSCNMFKYNLVSS